MDLDLASESNRISSRRNRPEIRHVIIPELPRPCGGIWACLFKQAEIMRGRESFGGVRNQIFIVGDTSTAQKADEDRT